MKIHEIPMFWLLVGIVIATSITSVIYEAYWKNDINVLVYQNEIIQEHCFFTIADNQFGLSVRLWNFTGADNKQKECTYLQRACENGIFSKFNEGVCKWTGVGCECRIDKYPQEPEVCELDSLKI